MVGHVQPCNVCISITTESIYLLFVRVSLCVYFSLSFFDRSVFLHESCILKLVLMILHGPFVLCRLFKKDDDFVLDATQNVEEHATPSPFLPPMDTKSEILSYQTDPHAGQNGEFKLMSAVNWKDESFVIPSMDTICGTDCQNHPPDGVEPEDIKKCSPMDMEVSINFQCVLNCVWDV